MKTKKRCEINLECNVIERTNRNRQTETQSNKVKVVMWYSNL